MNLRIALPVFLLLNVNAMTVFDERPSLKDLLFLTATSRSLEGSVGFSTWVKTTNQDLGWTQSDTKQGCGVRGDSTASRVYFSGSCAFIPALTGIPDILGNIRKFGHQVRLSNDALVLLTSQLDFQTSGHYGLVVVYARPDLNTEFVEIAQIKCPTSCHHFGNSVWISDDKTVLKATDTNGDTWQSNFDWSTVSYGTTEEPTTSPSISPSLAPTVSPTKTQTPSKQMAPLLSWYIERDVENTVVVEINSDNGTNPVMIVPFNVSNREYTSAIYYKDCFTELPDNEGIKIISVDEVGSGGGFLSIEVKLAMDLPKIINISNTEVYSGTEEGGDVHFCLKECLQSENATIVVHCVDTNVTVAADLTSEFASFNLTADLDRNDAEKVQKKVGYDDYVHAFICDNARKPLENNPPFTQGDALSICVESTKTEIVEIQRIEEMTLIQNEVNKFSAIENGKSTVATLVSTDGDNCLDNICQAKVQLLAMFFSQEDPDDLMVTGQVRLSLALDNIKRHLVEDSFSLGSYELQNLRNIHKRERVSNKVAVANDNNGGFETSVKLKSDFKSGSVEMNPFNYVVFICFGIVTFYTLW